MSRPSFVNSCLAARFAKVATCLFVVWIITAKLAIGADEEESGSVTRVVQKRIIGPTALVAEAGSELSFKARVDTGAHTSSVHVEEWAIEDESPDMQSNVGKRIRFCIKNHRDESQWLESRVEAISIVKTSEQEEERYKVEMTICLNDVRKRILVTLNDRSHMRYPMLLGRNFLRGDFVVDVDLNKKAKSAEPQAIAEEQPAEPALQQDEPIEVAQEHSLHESSDEKNNF